jgi:hypothetical protein
VREKNSGLQAFVIRRKNKLQFRFADLRESEYRECTSWLITRYIPNRKIRKAMRNASKVKAPQIAALFLECCIQMQRMQR